MRSLIAQRLAVLLALSASGAIACEGTTRTRVLRVFFDGVPSSPEAGGVGPALVGGTAGRAAPTAPVRQSASVHPPFGENQCSRCHDAARGNEADASSELCFGCHDEALAEGTVVHMPVEDGECLDCHHPHQSLQPALLRKPSPSICWECHDEELLAGTFKHEPAATGGCPVCHSPHAANQKRLLRKPVADLCADCHRSPHQAGTPEASSPCSKCHDPHSAEKEHLLR